MVYSLNHIFLGILVWAVGGHLHTYDEVINTKVSQEAKPQKPTGTFDKDLLTLLLILGFGGECWAEL